MIVFASILFTLQHVSPVTAEETHQSRPRAPRTSRAKTPPRTRRQAWGPAWAPARPLRAARGRRPVSRRPSLRGRARRATTAPAAAQGRGRPTAWRRASTREPAAWPLLGARALGLRRPQLPYREPQNRLLLPSTNFPPLSPTRNSAAALAASHSAVWGFPIGSAESGRGGASENAKRGGACSGSSASLGMPGGRGPRSHCMLGDGVFSRPKKISLSGPRKCSLRALSQSCSEAVRFKAIPPK